jgi:two-component system, OmpR family, alkaline phosphatase synthesis response regulator PhoP
VKEEHMSNIEPGAPVPARRPRVLLIDDDEDFRAATGAVLADAGYEVLAAPDARTGLARARDEAPDLVLLDVMMEDAWAGYGVNQALKFGPEGERRGPPIVMVSSVPLDPASGFGLAGEAPLVTPDAYLTKPVDVPKLLETVRRFVGGGGA